MHYFTYNQDMVNPTIVARWTKFKDLYGLKENHQVTMIHFG